MVAYSKELGSPIKIESISLKIEHGEEVVLGGLDIYLGHTTRSTLEADFNANYKSGTKDHVYKHDNVTLTGTSGEWFTIKLDHPFAYNGSDNLIIEFAWPSGDEAIYVWGWFDEVNRSVNAEFDDTSGEVSGESLYMRLNGSLSLEPATFGSIKATLGL